MADEESPKENTKDKRSILTQVMSEFAESERKQVKASIKTLLEDRKKAVQTLDSITDKIVEQLKSVGEDEDAIRILLKS